MISLQKWSHFVAIIIHVHFHVTVLLHSHTLHAYKITTVLRKSQQLCTVSTCLYISYGTRALFVLCFALFFVQFSMRLLCRLVYAVCHVSLLLFLIAVTFCYNVAWIFVRMIDNFLMMMQLLHILVFQFALFSHFWFYKM